MGDRVELTRSSLKQVKAAYKELDGTLDVDDNGTSIQIRCENGLVTEIAVW